MANKRYQTKSARNRNVRKADAKEELLDSYSRENTARYNSKKQKASARMRVILITVLVIIGLAAGSAFAINSYIGSINNELGSKQSEEERLAIQDELEPPKDYKEPFYALLVGTDARIGESKEGTRSDTTIIVRVDPINGTISLLSVPRDTMVQLDGYGTQKFNAIYAYEGLAGVIEATKELYGISIAHYGEVSFAGLIEAIDAVGGVEVEVSEMIDDPDAGDIIINEGLQTLNGEEALVFARSRAYPDGDFTRTSNQRLLVEALIQKCLTLPITEIPGVITALTKSISTDMKVEEVLSLMLQIKDVKDIKMYSAMIPSNIDMVDGISYVVTDQAALQEMLARLEQGEDPNPPDETPPDETNAPASQNTAQTDAPNNGATQ